MLGMHGTVTANYAVNEADLLLAFGARFDDRVTGARRAVSGIRLSTPGRSLVPRVLCSYPGRKVGARALAAKRKAGCSPLWCRCRAACRQAGGLCRQRAHRAH